MGGRTLPASFLFLPHTHPFRHLESGGGKGSVISEQSTWAEAGPRLAPGAQVGLSRLKSDAQSPRGC